LKNLSKRARISNTPVELELLSAGGLLSSVVPPDDRWVSALVIRGDGMTLVTQRLQVVGQNRPINQEPKAKSQEQEPGRDRQECMCYEF